MNSIKLFSISIFITFSMQSQKKEVQIITTKISDQVFMLKGQGGNIGLFIGDDAVFMIDDQFAPLTPKILEAIKKITPKPVNYLMNTHWHGDHTGGNLNMQKEGALILAHKNVRKRMSVDQVIRGKVKKASPKEALPVITFTEDMMMHINNDDIYVSHIHKAHTDGDALVYFTKNNILHTGDAYFQGKFPYIDLSSGGSINGYIDGIQKMIVLANDETKIIPGHGNISNKRELISFKKMLVDLKSRIQTEIDNGKTLEEVKHNKKITKDYVSFNGWITEEKIKIAIYKSLNK
ncbi:MBL fold metallo-hydrolase [Polaribacter sp. SA4-12]|uniref:MBL fold metallo-hydrolase n=1 Tax=Polaribacter sp. SA4-12 TaxID=1312072 RepID=UPI000B3C6D4B|nr:MBL fold metallo-hydrolase [Polaribacter sp. SA4-12]ARV13634.1 MBL fold metallo-hydrolase [Polaribacter sp. SA4-12]